MTIVLERVRMQQFDERQSMKRPDFEIFHYRDANVREVDVHHHDFYEIFFFFGGQVEYRIEGRSYRLLPGDLLLIGPEELHQTRIGEDLPYERMVLWINRHYLESLSTSQVRLEACFDTGHPNLLRLNAAAQRKLKSRLEELIHAEYSKEYGSKLYARGIFLQLMVELNRIVIEAQNEEKETEESPLIRNVLFYIHQHYNEPVSLEMLAGKFYISKYYLSHEFRKAVGTGVYRYVILRRLMSARQMLAEGETPGNVYRNCGFQDYANFYRAFLAEYGVSPSEFARSNQG